MSVKATMASEEEGPKFIGNLTFPNTRMWSKFVGAIQRGALDIPDLTVEVVPGKQQETVVGWPKKLVRNL